MVTGSNTSLLTQDIATELRGRYQDILMMPFSFSEFLRFRGIDCQSLMTSKRGLVTGAFDEWLHHGGYPEVCMASDSISRRQLIQNYLETVFYHDVIDRYSVKSRDLLEGIMSTAINGSAELFSVSAYARQLEKTGISSSKRSIATYLRYLIEAFFIVSSEKFSWSARKRTMNPEKVFLADTGFSMLSVSGSDNNGKLLETAVAGEFFRRGKRTFYFKEKNECDFVVVDGSKPSEVWQVCWVINSKNERREIAGLCEAMESLQVTRGGIITFDQGGTVETPLGQIPLIPAVEWFLQSP